MLVQTGQSRSDNFLAEISKIAVRLVLDLPFVLLCLLAALSLVACSPRNPQRKKDKMDRQATVGVWLSGTSNKSFGIMGYYSDGSFWTSNTYGSGPSVRSLTRTGTWNVVNGRLIITNREVAFWNWGTGQRPQFPVVDSSRIVWVTDQELALALDDIGLNLNATNIFILYKAVENKTPLSSTALEKAKKIKLSTVKFDSLPLAVVITMLQDESVKSDPVRKGVTISLAPDAKQLESAEINLDLKDLTLAETLGRVADSIGLELQATDTELLLVRKKANQ